MRTADAQTRFWAVRDSLAPVLRESKFREHGRITPEEFVLAGDFLVRAHPAWQWASGESSKAREYLPRDKQFLINKGVPCFRRVSTLPAKKRRSRLLSPSSTTSLSRQNREARAFGGTADDTEEVLYLDDEHDEHESWIMMHATPDHSAALSPDSRRASMLSDDVGRALPAHLERLSLDEAWGGARGVGRRGARGAPGSRASSTPRHAEAHDDDAEELSGFSDGLHEKEDPAQFVPGHAAETQAPVHERGRTHVTAVRTYDCMITYDKYYQTPRMWLIGYDENGLPLQPAQIFEDVASDYAFKTVTIEPFPHGSPGGGSMDHLLARRADHSRSPRSMAMHVASIHPCKHASMMHKMIARINDAASERGTDAAQAKPRTWAGAVRRLWGPSAEPANDEGGVQVDQYLIIFLKFMASIVPTIEIDAPHPV